MCWSLAQQPSTSTAGTCCKPTRHVLLLHNSLLSFEVSDMKLVGLQASVQSVRVCCCTRRQCGSNALIKTLIMLCRDAAKTGRPAARERPGAVLVPESAVLHCGHRLFRSRGGYLHAAYHSSLHSHAGSDPTVRGRLASEVWWHCPGCRRVHQSGEQGLRPASCWKTCTDKYSIDSITFCVATKTRLICMSGNEISDVVIN